MVLLKKLVIQFLIIAFTFSQSLIQSGWITYLKEIQNLLCANTSQKYKTILSVTLALYNIALVVINEFFLQCRENNKVNDAIQNRVIPAPNTQQASNANNHLFASMTKVNVRLRDWIASSCFFINTNDCCERSSCVINLTPRSILSFN